MFAADSDQFQNYMATRALQLGPLVEYEAERVRKRLPYKIPKGYRPWKAIAAEVGATLATVTTHFPKTAGDNYYSLLQGLWLATRSPLYAIKRDLLRAFELSDVAADKGLLMDINPPLPTFMLLLPQNALKTPDGTTIDNLTVHLADKAQPERSLATENGTVYGMDLDKLPNRHTLMWAALDSRGIIWHSRSGVTEQGTLENNFENSQGDLALSSEDVTFMKKVDAILCQVLLALTYRPDLLGEEAIATKEKPKGFGAAGEPRSPVLRPRWLGQTFKLPSGSPAPTNPGEPRSHNSPMAHWRRGHWRRVPVGPKDQGGRKWAFIQPTFVNG